ncbi:MAG: Nitroreductase family protein [Methanomassiliicoccales archaeon PtaU1.Bin124]|nr:MAG: Nitroreductase family protein [Methanomassiliicoccales archaeon PtaU1.Bin124]
MMQNELFDVIAKRRSIRKYQDRKVEGGDMKGVVDFLAQVKPLFPEIRTELRVLESATGKGLGSSIAPHFVSIFSEPKGDYLMNAGFMIQQVDLYLSSHGLGSCYQAMVKPNKDFVPPAGMECVISIVFGWPSVELHRKSLDEFKREPLSAISTVKGHDDIMQAARVAPSGRNTQSWFFTGGDGVIDQYYQKSLLFNDLRLIDGGIVLCHIWVAAEHAGKKVIFRKDADAAKNAPEKREYLISVHLQ